MDIEERFTLEDEIFVRGVGETWIEFFVDHSLELFADRLECFRNYLRVIAMGAEIREYAEVDMISFSRDITRKFHSGMREFNQLPEDDQAKLIHVNFQVPWNDWNRKFEINKFRLQH